MLKAALRIRVLCSHFTTPRASCGGARSPASRNASGVTLFDRVGQHPSLKVAVVDPCGKAHTYGCLLKNSANVASHLRRMIPDVAAQWGIWRAGGTAVPLCVTHPLSELEYVVADSAAAAVCSTSDFEGEAVRVAEAFGLPYLSIEDMAAFPAEGEDTGETRADPESGALIVYTSGTTGRPKGVLTPHRALRAQITDLVAAWGWTADDAILHFLPLHHVHGIVNKLCCAMWSGATVEFMRFSPEAAWRRLADTSRPLTLFMAVPTIYAKMIEAFDDASDPRARAAYAEGCKRLRLMVSGSAALPAPVMERWREITGHTLLERYGMTEFGMALSNPYRPASGRIPGAVGLPLPSVEVRVVDADTGRELGPGEEGELRVRGANVFAGYVNRPDASAEAFDEEGYFRTGDTAVFDASVGAYRILGRSSVDILKSGGYKVSALEIERTLLANRCLAEAVVVGVPDATWGERLVALVRRSHAPGAAKETEDSVRAWAKARLAPYKVPAQVVFVHDVPKNAMGKVNKKALVCADPDGHSGRLADAVEELLE